MENTEILQEEPIFRTKYIVNEKDEMDFQKFMTFKVNLVGLIILAVVYIFIFLFGIVFLRTISASMGFICFYILLLAFIVFNNIIKFRRRLQPDKSRIGNEVCISFYNDFFVSAFKSNETSFRYDNLKVYRTSGYFYIMVNAIQGFIVKNDSIEQGTADDLGKFLSEKNGLKFKVYK